MEIRSPKNEEEWDAYYDMRYRILREPLGQPRGSERNDLDEIGVHLALYENEVLMAIARLDQAESNVAQVRFVAVSDEARGKGYGRKIMEACEVFSHERGDIKMILQAREKALEFYKRMDYRLIEKTHLLFGQVQHYKMEKIY